MSETVDRALDDVLVRKLPPFVPAAMVRAPLAVFEFRVLDQITLCRENHSPRADECGA